MKITGIAVVRNEADIVGVCILHHLTVACDEVLVIDNGSTDRTPSVLRRLGRDRPVRWLRDDGPFQQSAMTTALAREAARRGADWVIPFDADEFWWSTGDPLPAILAASPAGGLRAPVRNFVQDRRQRRSSKRALRRLTWRAEPRGTTATAQADVEAGAIAFVEIDYPPKVVCRPTESIVIAQGNHDLSGMPGDLEWSQDLICLHAPLRSRAALHAKAANAPRVEEENPHPEASWHLKRWGRLAAAGHLDQEWAANSQRDGMLDVHGTRRALIRDHTLSDLIAPLLRPRRRSLLPTTSDPSG